MVCSLPSGVGREHNYVDPLEMKKLTERPPETAAKFVDNFGESMKGRKDVSEDLEAALEVEYRNILRGTR